MITITREYENEKELRESLNSNKRGISFLEVMGAVYVASIAFDATTGICRWIDQKLKERKAQKASKKA